ncbi:MAG: acyl-CoA dehydrogenase family protein [Nitrososphaerales archaeon]
MGILEPSISDYHIQLKPEHQEIQELAREFARNEIAPVADSIDKEDHIPEKIVRKMADLGFLGVPYPTEYGGVGSDYLSMALVIEELARISCAVSVIPVAHTLIAMPLFVYGSEEQKKRFLTPLAQGKKIGAHAMTEPAAGSDVAGIKTTAKIEDDEWLLNGTKTFCTNGDIADLFLVFARTSDIVDEERKRHLGLSGFVLERGMEGFTVGNPIGKMGIRGSKSVELVFEGVKVPQVNLLGEEGKGFYMAMDCYDHGRIEVAAQGIGVAQAALDAAAKYDTQRIAFGKPIMEFQSPQFMLGEAASEIQAARLLTYQAASLRDQGKEFMPTACMAKMYATEVGERTALIAIKLAGSAGVATEYPMERYLRDIQVTKIYEGTNDIQRLTLGRLIYKEAKTALGKGR